MPETSIQKASCSKVFSFSPVCSRMVQNMLYDKFYIYTSLQQLSNRDD